MCNTLHSPEHHLSRLGSWGLHAGIPSVGPGLLFHNAEMGADGPHLRQISAPFPVIQVIGMFWVLTQTVRKIRIGVISIYIQTFILHLMIIQIPKHAVCGDKILRFFIFPDNVALQSAEPDCAFRYKACVVQHLMGVGGVMYRRPRHINLLPLCIRLIPEHRPPGPVEGIKGLIFFLQEYPKRCRITL